MRIRFVSSTPMNVFEGSGTYVGIAVLARTLRELGVNVEILSPHFRCPNLALRRLLFNQYLRTVETKADVTVGFDMDGYTVAGKRPGIHVASIKGVIADEMRFERGWTHWTMGIQAQCERKHVHRADFVMTTSEYAAGRIQALYGVEERPRIVPELIDLPAWKQLLSANPISANRASHGPERFVVLTVCRFYPRKRLQILLAAAERLRSRIPEIEFRVVGGGPEERRLRELWRQKGLEQTAVWLEDISRSELAREYAQCDVFCLPSVQEGFGIVFLEAMAAGKPIVAARAGAAPEVVQHGLLAQPEDDEDLAAAIEKLYREPSLRTSLAAAGSDFVRQFDAPIVGRSFLRELEEFKASEVVLKPACA
jgi:glycosyltransferase involved in cell wall biosynthesis